MCVPIQVQDFVVTEGKQTTEQNDVVTLNPSCHSFLLESYPRKFLLKKSKADRVIVRFRSGLGKSVGRFPTAECGLSVSHKKMQGKQTPSARPQTSKISGKLKRVCFSRAS